MNVLIVSPNYPKRIKEYLVLPSLEVCIISRILKDNNHDVKLIDMKINSLDVEQLKSLLPDYNPDYVLIDDIPETHSSTKLIVEELRKYYGNKVKIVLRGEIASFEPEMIMNRNKNIDFIIMNDDDYALNNIINCINNKDDLSKISNICYRQGDEIIINKFEPTSYSLDSLPMPDRKLYDISKYLERDSETIVRSCRGCPSNCLFCIKSKFERFRIFSVKRFCDEIEELQSYGFKTFFFSDDTFAFSDKRLQDFADEVRLRDLKIKWTSNIRIKDITEEKIKLMKELGAYRVFVGIETINSRTSSVIGKNLVKDEIIGKIAILKKYGMQFHASFILGNPGDTEEDLENTIDFVKEISPDVITFNLIKVYPGLELYKHPEEYDIIMPDKFWFEKDDWASSVVMGTKTLPPEKLEKWSKRLLWEFIK